MDRALVKDFESSLAKFGGRIDGLRPRIEAEGRNRIRFEGSSIASGIIAVSTVLRNTFLNPNNRIFFWLWDRGIWSNYIEDPAEAAILLIKMLAQDKNKDQHDPRKECFLFGKGDEHYLTLCMSFAFIFGWDSYFLNGDTGSLILINHEAFVECIYPHDIECSDLLKTLDTLEIVITEGKV